MRLIDADKINFEEVFGGQSDFAKDLRKVAQELIESQPTAFDKEKVKEQIQIFRSKFECTCCPKNIGKHIPVSCDECMDTFAKVNIVIVEKGGIE